MVSTLTVCDDEVTLIVSGNAFHDIRDVKLYPSVGMKKQPPVHLKVNFGQDPFMFDIDAMVKVRRFCEVSGFMSCSLTIRSMR